LRPPAESGETRRPAAVLLRGGAVPAGLAGALVAGYSALVSPSAAGSALIGAVLAGAALSVGPLLLAATRQLSPPAVMAVAVGGYAITIGVLATAYLMLAGVSWLSGDHVGYAIAAVTAAWLAGQIRAVRRLRVLAFGSGSQGDARAFDAGQNGSPASPRDAPH
jgi:hypothetical protein